MTIFQCDSCQEQKPCNKMRVESKLYDICAGCRETILALIKAPGEVAWSDYGQIMPLGKMQFLGGIKQ